MRFDFDCERCGQHVAWTTEDICADCMAQERDEEMDDLRRQLAEALQDAISYPDEYESAQAFVTDVLAENSDFHYKLAAVTAERDAALELANARANTSTPFATAYRDGVVLYFKDGKGPQNGIIPPLPRPGWEWREYIPRRLVAGIESERDAARAERDAAVERLANERASRQRSTVAMREAQMAEQSWAQETLGEAQSKLASALEECDNEREHSASVARELTGQLAALKEQRDAARLALQTVSDIRDSIIGTQSINWSEHIYPLVAVLDGAGFPGSGYEVARENLGTLLEQRDAARAEVARLRSALSVLLNASGVATALDAFANDCQTELGAAASQARAALGLDRETDETIDQARKESGR